MHGTAATPWTGTLDDVAREFGTDPRVGLTAAEALRRRERIGPNELDPPRPVSIWRRIAGQLVDPLVVLLLVAIAVATAAWWWDGPHGWPVEPIVVAVIVAVNAALGTWQETRAEQAVAALRRLTVASVTVRRDRTTITVPASELVPGDVLVLAAGDAVGADCRLIETASLTVAEAALTGESEPVDKQTGPVDVDAALADRSCMVFQSTAVATGRGVGIVVATGMSTEIGRIARLIDETETTPTPLQQQLGWLGRVLGAAVVALATLVFVVIVATSEVRGVATVIDAGLVGVSLAVAAVPEGLPAILSIVLAMGVRRMAGDHAIVKQLSSVETLGSASVICSDKTGTLTRNEMTVVSIVVPGARVDVTGADPPATTELSIGDVPVTPGVRRSVETILMAGSYASDARIERGDDGSVHATGDPTEAAIVVAAEHIGASSTGATERFDEIPFDTDRRMMSTMCRTRGVTDDGRRDVMFTKGAPDVVIERCRWVMDDGRPRSMTDDDRAEWHAVVDDLAGEALRTLAIAFRPVDDRTDRSETGLTLLGIVGIVDPPRPEARPAIEDAHRGGVRVVMVTGDHPRTAGRIAHEVGIDDADRVVTGAELARLDGEALVDAATTANVYARVEPADKLRLVRALQASGHVTAMTGDGVNDGPALRQADIGVAMGRGGTEVAREAADMVLADDHVATIVRAIREGREIYADIQKFLRYLLASNTGEVLVVLLGVLLAGQLGVEAGAELAVPLLATQILWINLVTDGPLALALGVDPAIDDVMHDPPRPRDARVVDAAMLRTIVVVGLSTAMASLVALDLGLAGGQLGGTGDIETARTMAFTTLVLAQVGNALTARSDRTSAFHGMFSNRQLWLAIVATVAAQVAVVHVPGLNAAFDATPLTVGQWSICTGLALGVLVVAEVAKAAVRRHPHAVAVPAIAR